MRNATTLRMFAVLIGLVLALPAAAEEQNSSTLKTEPVSADKVAGSCSAASTLVDSSSAAFGGIHVGVLTPRNAASKAIFPRAAAASANAREKICVAGDCSGVGTPCALAGGGYGVCKAVNPVADGYYCTCWESPGHQKKNPGGH